MIVAGLMTWAPPIERDDLSFRPKRLGKGQSMLGYPDLPPSTSVEVAGSLGEWFVRITKDGASTIHAFERRRFALAFAEEQRVRLGVDRIVITEENASALWSRDMK